MKLSSDILTRFLRAGFTHKADYLHDGTADFAERHYLRCDGLGLSLQCDIDYSKCSETWVFGFGRGGKYAWTGCDFPDFETCVRVAFAILSGFRSPGDVLEYPFRCYAAREVHPFDLYVAGKFLSDGENLAEHTARRLPRRIPFPKP